MKAALRSAPPAGLETRGPVLTALSSAVRTHLPGPMETRLADIRAFLESDLAGIEHDLSRVDHRPTPLHDSAHHLIGLGGKRVRPMCVALAARAFGVFGPAARDLAVAAELVHSATLLHDDVVDLGDRRRGAPTARVLYGNAASVYAGDWLLVEALMRVRRAGLTDVLDRALGVLAEMLEAEALQLAARGRVDTTLSDYMRVVRGKTASLFRWALYAGARAGGASPSECAPLEHFGESIGLAFQVVDDALDVDGDAEAVGKSLLADLVEGKVTYPLLVAFERDPSLARVLGDRLAASRASGASALDPETATRAAKAIRDAGGAVEARRLADSLAADAIAFLAELPDTPARTALTTIAHAIVTRRS
ncbi:MAG: polyprenyl synthetase family protein [Polyangiaceae bacterium]